MTDAIQSGDIDSRGSTAPGLLADTGSQTPPFRGSIAPGSRGSSAPGFLKMMEPGGCGERGSRIMIRKTRVGDIHVEHDDERCYRCRREGGEWNACDNNPHKSLKQYVENVIEEQLHDLDPVRVRARRRTALNRLQPLRVCNDCRRSFHITTLEEAPFNACPECRQRQARRRRRMAA